MEINPISLFIAETLFIGNAKSKSLLLMKKFY